MTGPCLAVSDVSGREAPQCVFGIATRDAGPDVPDWALAPLDQLEVAGDP